MTPERRAMIAQLVEEGGRESEVEAMMNPVIYADGSGPTPEEIEAFHRDHPEDVAVYLRQHPDYNPQAAALIYHISWAQSGNDLEEE